MNGGVSVSDPLTVDDVLDAHRFLADYRGDAKSLCPPAGGRKLIEWQLIGVCPDHGKQVNTVTTDSDQTVTADYVVCAGCLLESSVMVRLQAMLILRQEET